MSGARTVWHDLEVRRNVAINRQRAGLLLAVVVLLAMSVAEIAFLNYIATPETVNLLMAAGGMPIGVE
ncbi:MAG TPA: hypothetical protein VHT74_20360 [Acetobacteraceae bacterium]|jgi:hypothetical protein|nr:hypothetical protein [Acetobacteraceae bacterium]